MNDDPTSSIDELGTREDRLVADLREAAEHMEVDGRPVSSGLCERLDEHARSLLDLDQRVRGAAADRQTASVDGLRDVLESHEVLREAERLLDHLLVLECDGDCEPLDRLRGEWRALRRDLRDGGPSEVRERAVEIVASTHPWKALAVLTGFAGEASDEKWQSAHEVVGASLGTVIATAAARQRLTRRRTRPAARANPMYEADRAGTAPTGVSSRSAGSLADEAFRLVGEDRAALAAHLLASADDDSSELPVWLMQLVALAPHVRSPVGEVAAAIERVMAGAGGARRVAARAGELSSTGRAHALLVRAATIWPSLVCPETGVVRILRSLNRGEVDAPIHDFCSTIAGFAERSGGLVVSARDGGGATPGTAASEASAAATWFGEVLERHLVFTRSRPAHLEPFWTVRSRSTSDRERVLEHWREACRVLSAVRRVLQPVIENNGSRWVEVEDSARSLRRESGSTLVDVVESAVGFTERWLEAVRGRHGRRARAGEKEIETLREKVEFAWPEVAMCLDALERTGTLPERVAAGVLHRECLRVRDFLSGVDTRSPGGAEPDPRIVLNGELLAIEGVELDEEWRVLHPESSELHESILAHLSTEPLDWPLVLESAVASENWPRVEQLLRLDVWSIGDRARIEREVGPRPVRPAGNVEETCEPLTLSTDDVEVQEAAATVGELVDQPQNDGWILDVFDDDESGGIR